MRVELRLERDEHEFGVDITCDQMVSPERAVKIACDALAELVNGPIQLPHTR